MSHQQLQIKDIERLAAAGVKIELNNIDPISDLFMAPEPPQRPRVQSSLADAVWERWYRSRLVRSAGREHEYEGSELPFSLLASQHGDKVWVSVHPGNVNHEPFQLQDPAAIFPSDALMASLALWEANHK